MKKKILIGGYILLGLVFLEFLITFLLNEVFICQYKNEDYNKTLGKSLLVLSLSERYIAHYNYGNLLYQIGYFEDAIDEYNTALESNPSEGRVCSIRINLALTIVATINEDMECGEQLEKYAQAREVLYGDNCAYATTDTGKSETAEELELEIMILEAQTKQACESSSSSDDGDDEDDSDNSSEDEEKSEEEKKSKEVEERNKDASESRQDELDIMESYDNYSYYNGKKW